MAPQRPRLLDLFCGAGGATRGYQQAGFYVVGVDIADQPTYCGDEFIRADAVAFLYSVLPGEFAAVHASPPCQAKTTMSNRWRGKGGKADGHVNLIPATLDALQGLPVPWVVENVPGARCDLPNAFTLTGGMFGLRVHRPRLFTSNTLVFTPPAAKPPRDSVGVYGTAHDGRLLWRRADGTEQHAASSLEEARAAMGMPWADWRGIAEAIPPAYTEFIGAQLLAHIESERVA